MMMRKTEIFEDLSSKVAEEAWVVEAVVVVATALGSDMVAEAVVPLPLSAEKSTTHLLEMKNASLFPLTRPNLWMETSVDAVMESAQMILAGDPLTVLKQSNWIGALPKTSLLASYPGDDTMKRNKKVSLFAAAEPIL